MNRRKGKRSMGKCVSKGVIVFGVLACICVGFYAYLSNRSVPEEEEVIEVSVAQEVLLRDLTSQYPPSPREVVKYYSDLTLCLHNEKYSDEEFEKLALQARGLYDQELNDNNKEEENFLSLKSEVEDYQNMSQTISSYTLSSSTSVEYWKKEGRDMASLYCTYIFRKGKSTSSVTEQFILRKDDAGNWKILGWTVANKK